MYFNTILYNFVYSNANRAYDLTTNTWTDRAPLPTLRAQAGAAAVNGKIYVIGGNGNDGDTGVNEVYDPNTNTWTTKAPMPTARSGFAFAVAHNKVYAIGGRRGQQLLNVVEEYDPLTDTWRTRTPFPATTASVGCAVNNRIYVFTSSPWEYDPVIDGWTPKAPMPTARGSFAVTELEGKIYAIGGVAGGFGTYMTYKVNEEYDPATNTWTTKAPMQFGRSSLVAVSALGKIFAIGGMDINLSSFNVYANEEYSPTANLYVHTKN
jgi:N-acetylneuraminic acid mutarotase